MLKKFPKAAIPAMVALKGLAIFQTMSMMSFQSAAAERPFNQGKCMEFFQEGGWTKKDAHDECHRLILNQGECLEYARELGFTPEEIQSICKDFFSPPSQF